MRIKATTGAALSLWLLAGQAAELQHDRTRGPVARIFFLKTKGPTFEPALLAGFQRHYDWHVQEKDRHANWLFRISTGERAGQYVNMTPHHHWADFAEQTGDFGRRDMENYRETFAEYMEIITNVISVQLHDLDRPIQEGKPAPLNSVTFFRLKIGKDADFAAAQRRIHTAVVKADYPSRYVWYKIVNGDQMPSYIMVREHKDWASFAPPTKGLDALLDEVYGVKDAQDIRDRLAGAIESERNELWVFQSGLCYPPGSCS